MKIYKEEQEEKKSWSLRLCRDDDGNVYLNAVDSKNGSLAAHILYFADNGGVINCDAARETISENGYNPREHGNIWDEEGRIVIGGE